MYQTAYSEMIDYTYDWPEHDMVQGYPVPYEEESDDWFNYEIKKSEQNDRYICNIYIYFFKNFS